MVMGDARQQLKLEIAGVLPMLSEEEKIYLLGYIEGLASKLDAREQQSA